MFILKQYYARYIWLKQLSSDFTSFFEDALPKIYLSGRIITASFLLLIIQFLKEPLATFLVNMFGSIFTSEHALFSKTSKINLYPRSKFSELALCYHVPY